MAGATLRTRVEALHKAGLVLSEISAVTGETEARLQPVLDAVTRDSADHPAGLGAPR
jgi:hypothetical protein